MNIYIEKDPAQNRWWVHMDLWAVSFHSREGAVSFVERLNARINAPHSLIPEVKTQEFSKGPPLVQNELPQSIKQLSQA
ncbi:MULTISPECIES: hypothetical protein [Pseudomonas]|uniref:Uncharacterized protein n=1 Tax=Pseudomonas brassicacearum TaxID=930166 RepID=A0AAJ3FYH2_9PSED|nr:MULTISPECIES: hypothetical protein [Pseudomonas]NUT83154.1 hypothetical protein [Pseudomonas brassicacearum]QGA50165.1 hypothetical protein GFU70_13845 [Pseudomonas brassicacearum]